MAILLTIVSTLFVMKGQRQLAQVEQLKEDVKLREEKLLDQFKDRALAEAMSGRQEKLLWKRWLTPRRWVRRKTGRR